MATAAEELKNLPAESGNYQIAETNQARAVAEARAEMEGAVLMARRFPRDMTQVWQRMEQTCRRKTFAENAQYSFPRGGKKIEGPSVKLSRALVTLYGNIHSGSRVIRDEPDKVVIQGYAWDLESGARSTVEDVVNKSIYRKPNPQKGFAGGWITPDERDLRELVSKRSAIAERNCQLKVMPFDLIEDSIGLCKQTLRENIKDPKGEQKKLIIELSKFNITVEMVQRYFGHKEDWSADEIVELRGILNGIADGEAKRDDYFRARPAASGDEQPPDDPNKSTADRLADKLGATEPEPEKEKAPEKVKSATTTKADSPPKGEGPVSNTDPLPAGHANKVKVELRIAFGGAARREKAMQECHDEIGVPADVSEWTYADCEKAIPYLADKYELARLDVEKLVLR